MEKNVLHVDESGFFTFPLHFCVLFVKGNWSLKSPEVNRQTHHLHLHSFLSHTSISLNTVSPIGLYNRTVFKLNKAVLWIQKVAPWGLFSQVHVRGNMNQGVQIEGLQFLIPKTKALSFGFFSLSLKVHSWEPDRQCVEKVGNDGHQRSLAGFEPETRCASKPLGDPDDPSLYNLLTFSTANDWKPIIFCIMPYQTMNS